MLKFSGANAKTKKLANHPKAIAHFGRKPKVYGFSLPSGYTCPGASECLSKADRQTGKITDGPNTQYRCFMASLEGTFKNLRDMAWRNFDQLRHAPDEIAMSWMLNNALPVDADIVRVHVGGDFFNEAYFKAWMMVAHWNPNTIFYAYTKSLNYWAANVDLVPSNFKLVASAGGRFEISDTMRTAHVVYSEVSRSSIHYLEIDHDESHHVFGNSDFALLLHGIQPKGSDAARALKVIKAGG